MKRLLCCARLVCVITIALPGCESEKDWLFALWGDEQNLLAVGDAGSVLRYDGQTWDQIGRATEARLTAIWGVSADDFFVAGEGGAILRFQQGTWTKMTSGTGKAIHGLWGETAGSIFAVGDSGTVRRFSESKCSVASVDAGAADAAAGDAGPPDAGSDDSGESCDPTGWDAVDLDIDEDLRAVWGIGSDFVLAAGDAGRLLRLDDGDPITAGLVLEQCEDDETCRSGICGFTTQPAGCGDSDTSQACVGSQRRCVSHRRINSLFGSDLSNIFAADEGGAIHHYDGARWTVQRESDDATQALLSIHGSGPTRLFVAGLNGAVLRYDAAAKEWLTLDRRTGEHLRAVWTRERGTFVVGDNGTLLALDD